MKKGCPPQTTLEEDVEDYRHSLTAVQREKLRLITIRKLALMGFRQGEFREGSRTWLKAEHDAIVGLLLNCQDIDRIEIDPELASV